MKAFDLASPARPCLAGFALLFLACSGGSSGASGGGASGDASSPVNNACFNPGLSEGCDSCLATMCGSYESATSGACSAYLNCTCPGGTYDSALVSGCQSTVTDACANEEVSLLTCEFESCASACAGPGDAGAHD